MIAPSYVGCDVSSQRLDLCLLTADGPRYQTAPNTPAGHAKLVDILRSAQERPMVVLEATAGYERPFMTALAANEIATCRLMPQRLRQFARAQGQLAKTDLADAHMLALYGAHMHPAPTAVESEDLLDLRDLWSRRRHLVSRRATDKVHLARAGTGFLRDQIGASLAAIETQIKALDARIAERIAQKPDWVARTRRHESVPGIGPKIAAALVAYVPELGALTRAQSAALVGVAPYARDSGRLRGRRVCQGGRKPIRDLLFMAAVSVSRMPHTPHGALYARLVQAGKPKKLALIAVIRKLVTTLNALERTQKIYQS